MSGSVAGPTPSITRWVQHLDKLGEKDSSNVRGNENRLHIRTGFEKFSEGLQKLFNKKDPGALDGMKSRVYEGIKRDYGEKIADNVFSKFEHASTLTVGDLRAMANMAKAESRLAHAQSQISMPQVANITKARVLADNYAPDPNLKTAYSGRHVDTTIQIMGDVLDRYAGKMTLSDDRVSLVTTMVTAQVRKDIMALCDGGNHEVTHDQVTKIVEDRMTQTLDAIHDAGGQNMSARALTKLISSEHGIAFDERSFNAEASGQPRVSGQTPRPQLEQLAQAYAKTSIKDIALFNDKAMAVYQYTSTPSTDPTVANGQRQRAESATPGLQDIINKYKGTAFLDTMNPMSVITQKFDQLSVEGNKPSGERGKTNMQVLDDHVRQMGGQFGLNAKLGFGGSSSKAMQLSMRLEMLENTALKVNIEKYTGEQDPQKLGGRLEQIKKTATEIQTVIDGAIADYSAFARMTQDPAFLEGLTPTARAMVIEMGVEYGKLASALADPNGPAQGLVAMGHLAAMDPGLAGQLYAI